MQQLSVIGVEDDVLILEAESGERFRVPVDALPERRKPAPVPHRERKARPRDIQALIRGGMTAEEVAQSTGEELAYVERFEGPVLAERAHILDTALSIAVASGDIDPLAGETTFGAALEGRLDELRATHRSWAAWKDGEGGTWTIRLRFTVEGAQHEATWAYEPKKAALTPRGKEATSLSQTGDASSVLVPRLRAIDRQSRPTPPGGVSGDGEGAPAEEGAAPPISQRARTVDAARTDTDRFDSDAFRLQRGRGAAPRSDAPADREQGSGSQASGAQAEEGADAPSDGARGSASLPEREEATRAENPWLRARTGEVGTQPENVQAAAINRPAAAAQPNHTAELLDALRRRRSEREAALRTAESEPSLFEVEEQPAPDAAEGAGEPSSEPGADARPGRQSTTGGVGGRKRGSRAAMPSWDEIVFGSRSDDDR